MPKKGLRENMRIFRECHIPGPIFDLFTLENYNTAMLDHVELVTETFSPDKISYYLLFLPLIPQFLLLPITADLIDLELR